MSKISLLAKNAPKCCGCGRANDGTVVLAHRNLSAWGLRFGKGIKTIDLLGAHLCHDCHVYGDGKGRKDYQFWELAVHRTITWIDKEHGITIG